VLLWRSCLASGGGPEQVATSCGRGFPTSPIGDWVLDAAAFRGEEREGVAAPPGFVQPEKDSLEAMATEFFSIPLGQHLEQQLSAAAVELHVAELVDADRGRVDVGVGLEVEVGQPLGQQQLSQESSVGLLLSLGPVSRTWARIVGSRNGRHAW